MDHFSTSLWGLALGGRADILTVYTRLALLNFIF